MIVLVEVREQLALPVTAGTRRGGLGGRVQAFHPAHDQPAADVVGGAPGGERGERHLGDLGVAYQALLGLVPDRVGVVDRRPGIVAMLAIAVLTPGCSGR